MAWQDSSLEIDIAKYVAELDSTPNPTWSDYYNKLHQLSVKLSGEIRTALLQKEALKSVEEPATHNRLYPILENNEPEIIFWAASIITSAWTKWVFTAKTNNPNYQNDPAYVSNPYRQAAIVNVKLALPYVKTSIGDAITKGCDIGRNAQAHYRPQETSAKMTLRKAD